MRAPFVVRLAFVAYVIAEVALFVLAVRWLGGWVTLLLVLSTTLLGGWLIRNEGLRAFGAVNEAVQAGRAPGREVADTGVVLTGGLLLVLPGFLTDIAGLLAVLPPTRPLARRLLARARLAGPRRQASPDGTGPVIPGEVIDPAQDRRGNGPVIRGNVIESDPADPDDSPGGSRD